MSDECPCRGVIGLITCPECHPCHLRHLTACTQVRDLEIHTTAPRSMVDGLAGVRFGVSGEDLLAEARTLAVVVAGGKPDARSFWISRCVAAGIRVLGEPPLGGGIGPAGAAVSRGATSPGLLVPMARSVFTPTGIMLKEPPGPENRVVTLELTLSVPNEDAQADPGGVLRNPGLDYLGLLEPAFGPVDAIWARTRSLLRQGPTEDWAVIALRFRSGTEGVVRINGLGQDSLVSLDLYGRAQALSTAHPLPAEDGPELARVYDWFISSLAEPRDTRDKGLPGYDLASAFRLYRWAQQSARTNREVQWHEVVHGT